MALRFGLLMVGVAIGIMPKTAEAAALPFTYQDISLRAGYNASDYSKEAKTVGTQTTLTTVDRGVPTTAKSSTPIKELSIIDGTSVDAYGYIGHSTPFVEARTDRGFSSSVELQFDIEFEGPGKTVDVRLSSNIATTIPGSYPSLASAGFAFLDHDGTFDPDLGPSGVLLYRELDADESKGARAVIKNYTDFLTLRTNLTYHVGLFATSRDAATADAVLRFSFADPAVRQISSLDTPSTVPLPASAPMFGAALLALGAVGYGLKRKGMTAAAA